MELVSQLIKKQKERPNLNQNIYSNSNDITVYFNGAAIGTVQSISSDRTIEPVHIGSEEEAYFHFGDPQIQKEMSIVIDQGNLNQRLLMEMLQDQMQTVSVYYEYERLPNRAERRGHKREEENFKKGVRRMLGGHHSWS